MIFKGKTIQSVADSTIYPFFNDLLQSQDETVVREILNHIKILAGLGIERKNFLGLQKVLYHKNMNIARNSLDILREMSPSVIQKEVEVKTDTWKSMFPFFCNQALSTSSVAIDSLKIIDVLVDYGIVGDYKNLQNALLHKSDNVARLALDILRKIKGYTAEVRVTIVKPIGAEKRHERIERKEEQQIKEIEQPIQKENELKSRIFSVLQKNPKYVESLRDIKSKYNV